MAFDPYEMFDKLEKLAHEMDMDIYLEDSFYVVRNKHKRFLASAETLHELRGILFIFKDFIENQICVHNGELLVLRNDDIQPRLF